MRKRRDRIGIACVFVMAMAGSADAQIATRYAGITGGATYSDLSNYAVDTEGRWGGTAGLVVGTVTFDYSYVELAPAWTQQGGGDLRMDYVDIPLLIGGLMPVGGGNILLRLYAGVGLGIKVACNQEIVCAAAKSTVWSLPVGASFGKAVGGGRFVGLDARYAFGLSDAFDLTEATHRSWQFRLLFGLPIGR